MRMILIDAKNRTFQEAEYTGLESLQKAVGGLIEPIPFYLPHEIPLVHKQKAGCQDSIYVDEEGLYKDYNFGFVVDGMLFIGNGVVAGVDFQTGKTIPAVVSIEELKTKIDFVEIRRGK